VVGGEDQEGVAGAAGQIDRNAASTAAASSVVRPLRARSSRLCRKASSSAVKGSDMLKSLGESRSWRCGRRTCYDPPTSFDPDPQALRETKLPPDVRTRRYQTVTFTALQPSLRAYVLADAGNATVQTVCCPAAAAIRTWKP